MKDLPYTLRREQVVPRKLEEVFEFFSRAKNLEFLTPEWLRFKVLNVDPEPLRRGSLISYALRVHGLTVRWTSAIVEWDPPHKFVDLQVRGPYKRWHHTHRFQAEGERTRITDEVRYELPLGSLGRIAHRLMVRSDLERIFAFREEKICDLFGCKSD
jgi:ligand-binding SRPBCC domain-containing protein